MAELTAIAKDRALKMLFGVDAVIGLTAGAGEVGDRGYQVQPFKIGEPQLLEPGIRFVSNVQDIRFGPWTEDAKNAVTGWLVRDRSGDLLAIGEFKETQQPKRGDEVVVHPGELLLGLN